VRQQLLQSKCRAVITVEPKQYYLSRAILDPPEILQVMVFPKLEESYELMKQSVTEMRKTEISGHSFLSLLKHLRVFILQDAAILLQTEDYKSRWLLLDCLVGFLLGGFGGLS